MATAKSIARSRSRIVQDLFVKEASESFCLDLEENKEDYAEDKLRREQFRIGKRLMEDDETMY